MNSENTDFHERVWWLYMNAYYVNPMTLTVVSYVNVALFSYSWLYNWIKQIDTSIVMIWIFQMFALRSNGCNIAILVIIIIIEQILLSSVKSFLFIFFPFF